MRKILRQLLVVMVIMSMCSVAVFAADATDTSKNWGKSSDVKEEQINDYYNSLSPNQKNSITKALNGQDLGSNSTDSKHTIEVGGQTYHLSEDGFAQVQNKVYNISSQKELKSQVADMGVKFDTKADTASAAETLSGLQEFVSTINGLLVYVVVLGMSLFTALDCCYITMPVFRGKMDTMAQGGGRMTTTSTKSGRSES